MVWYTHVVVRGSTFGQLCSKPLEVCGVLEELHQLPHLMLGLLNLAAAQICRYVKHTHISEQCDQQAVVRCHKVSANMHTPQNNK